jgi:hypothetical protein
MNKEVYFWEKYINDFPLIGTYGERWLDIKNEVLSFLNAGGETYDYPQYLVPKVGTITEYSDIYINSWKVIPVSKYHREYFDTERDDEIGEYCRKIVEISKKNLPTIDEIISPYEDLGVLRNAFVSKLDPGSIINPHRGRSNLYMRIHLGLDCDPECKITVGRLTKTWQDGRVLAFKDGGKHLHGVSHTGTKQRIILSVDVEIEYLKQYVNEKYFDQLML